MCTKYRNKFIKGHLFSLTLSNYLQNKSFFTGDIAWSEKRDIHFVTICESVVTFSFIER